MVLELAAALSGTGFIAYAYTKLCAHKYWSRKGLKALQPSAPFGNASEIFEKRTHISQGLTLFYNDFKSDKARHGGIYFVNTPVYIPVDPVITKSIIGATTKESDNVCSVFNGRSKQLIFKHIINAEKNIISLLQENEKSDLEAILRKLQNAILKSLIPLENESFLEMQQFSNTTTTSFLVSNFLLKLLKFFSRSCEDQKSYKSLRTLVKNSVENRSDMDFIFSVFALVESQQNSEGDNISNATNYLYGFITSVFDLFSSSLMFGIKEVMSSTSVQERILAELDEVLNKYDGKLTFEGIQEMTYLDNVLLEIVRLYPPTPFIHLTIKKTFIPPTSVVCLAEDITVFIPTTAIHQDEDHYQDPLIFNPERFENVVSDEVNYTFLPFGSNTSSEYSALLLPAKIALVFLLKDRKLSLDVMDQQVAFDRDYLKLKSATVIPVTFH